MLFSRTALQLPSAVRAQLVTACTLYYLGRRAPQSAVRSRNPAASEAKPRGAWQKALAQGEIPRPAGRRRVVVAVDVAVAATSSYALKDVALPKPTK